MDMSNQPRTAQGWAWDYLKNHLEDIVVLLGLSKRLSESKNMPKVFTFADLKEGEFFIRFPWARIENGNLIFKNAELYRKIRPLQDGSRGYRSAMRVMTSSLDEIPDNEPVIVVK